VSEEYSRRRYRVVSGYILVIIFRNGFLGLAAQKRFFSSLTKSVLMIVYV
jgi:hypothetical protein